MSYTIHIHIKGNNESQYLVTDANNVSCSGSSDSTKS